jgi:putative Holliday junction resolvase
MKGNYLGIDWGKKEIGLALAHSETGLALVLGMIKNEPALWNILAQILEDHEVGVLIVGLPRYPEAGTMTRTEQFAKEAQKRFPDLQVHLADEMFTSKMAIANLRAAERAGESDHAEAARIILQEWLEHRR